MDREVYFSITSPGYEYPPDFFGNPGRAFKVTKGDSALVKIKRINVAERLYRFTGEGLYHHSMRVGHSIPIKQPVLNAGVTGLDATLALPYNGKIFWFWGDTKKLSNSIGHFAVSGATSEFPNNGGLDPDIGIDLTFFVDETGFSKQMCPVPGPGMVWHHWMGILKDDKGKERLVLHYGRMKDLGIVYESGLAIFNDEKEIFEPVFQYDSTSPFWPKGHYLEANINGENYHYFSFGTPYSLRTIADLEHIKDINSYEAFTCLKEGTRYTGASSEIDRNKEGEIIYSWKAGTDPVGYKQQKELIDNGVMKQEEGWLQLCDIEEGTRIVSHAGSVYWNDYRKKWVMIIEEFKGIPLGDIWYAEGDSPVGPWVYAKKIATHNKYNFYNVTQHPFFDKDGGRYIYFDGTYSTLLSQMDYETPRYEYNQIMYCLDLNDPLLYLPAPVYYVSDFERHPAYLMRETVDSLNLWQKINEVPFFAIPNNRKLNGLVPVYLDKTDDKQRLKTKFQDIEGGEKNLLFYGLPSLINKEEQISGTWECEADGFPFTMDLLLEGKELDGMSYGLSLVFNKGSLSNDTIELILKDSIEQITYILSVQIINGKLSGKYQDIENNSSGSVTGSRTDFIWKLISSPAVVPLFEYQCQDSSYYYSIDPNLQGMSRSNTPLCNVWKNPSTTLALDFEAKPLPVIK
ncbi:MAG: hypothetical protein KAT33_08445 [Bacteroidales bacterium]|nr:hypothetical protein [Bacteroidales bacterium]